MSAPARAPARPPRATRIARNLAAVALIAGLLAGTLVWQTDDTWPLAQMRMFPGGSESAVALVVIRAELANGRTREMNPFDFHLKRAELEGQVHRVHADPAMLGALIDRYNAGVGRGREIRRIVLIRRETVREGGHTRRIERELVRWPA
jgi:hypothetical protein